MNLSGLLRRTAGAAGTILLLLSVVVSCVMANVIASQPSLRVRRDVTSTREHALASHTRSIVSQLAPGHEIVVAVARGSADEQGRPRYDPQAVAQVEATLREIDLATANLRVTWINTDSADGQREYNDLLDRLLDRDRALIRSQIDTISQAVDVYSGQSLFLRESLAPSLARIAATIPPDDPGQSGLRNLLTNIAESTSISLGDRILRTAEELRAMVPAGEAIAWPLPQLDTASARLAPELRTRAGEIAALADRLEEHASVLDESASADALAAARACRAQRDALARAADEVSRLMPPDLLRIGRTIEASSAALIVGPRESGIRAIDMASLIPSSDVIDANSGLRTNVKLRTEELVTAALSSMLDPDRPIVVLIHAESQTLLDKEFLFGMAVNRLRLKGIDVLEWPVALVEEPPSLSSIDPDSKRPVVYVCHNTYAVAADRDSGDRAARLGAVLARLADDGAPILMSVNVCVLPSLNLDDPTTAFLSRWGLRALSGTPILDETTEPEGRRIVNDQPVRGASGEHAISGALHRLDTLLPWAIPIVKEGAGGRATVTPLLTLESKAAWRESEWVLYHRVPRAERPALPDKPKFDERRDARDGPWPVAVAVEAPNDDGSLRQRAVVVGSNGWFLNEITQQQYLVDGRIVQAYPGNMELLEASVLWLAGRDALIGQAAVAQAVPRVRAVNFPSDAARWGFYLMLVLGPAVVVLLAGATVRLVLR